VRIPYPERIPIDKAAYFVLALFVIQVLEGTTLFFCVGISLFILIATITFNEAGGLTRASGAYVFFYAVLVVIVGVCYKAFLGEAAQTNLADPQTDIEAYVGSITAMYAAVTLSRRVSRKTGLLQNVLKESSMYRASVGCILFGALGGFGIALLGESGTQLQTAFNQINNLIPVGIIIGVTYEIRRSGGTRCTNLFVVIGTAYVFFQGVTAFSKQGMIEPLFCWLLPIWFLRYRLSIVQVAGCCLAVFIVFYYLVPYSQYGRSLVTENFTLSDRVALATDLLGHPNETRQTFVQGEEDRALQVGGTGSYFNSPQGFWERLQFVSVDDSLINFTDQGHVFGLLPVEYGFIDMVPHFLWPNKPVGNLGNMYSHEINGEAQGEGDVSTGISFSPTAEAFHVARWSGIFLLAPALWFMLFTIMDSLLGDVRTTPWGMLAVALISHSAPEAGIVGTIGLWSVGVEGLVFCAFFAAWFAPVIATFVVGPGRGSHEAQLSLKPSITSGIPR
jgi:hypothetical protein